MRPRERGEKLLDALLEKREQEAADLLNGEVDFSVTSRGDHPIHLAARNGKLELIKLMKKAKADLSQKNQAGNTAMHYAAKTGNIEMVKYLKEQGVKLNEHNTAEGHSPLEKAVMCQTMNVIEELINLGMKPNTQNNKSGDTPLHTAMRIGAQEAMEGLLIKGAKPNIENFEGKKPEDVAKNTSIRESLKMYATLLIAMSSGYIKAKGMKIAQKQLKKDMVIDRVGVVLASFDIPKEFPTGFYCRREKAENATVELTKKEGETVFSDVFHFRIFEVARDCKAVINLPLYQAPTDKEQLVLRFINCDLADRVVDILYIGEKKVPYCPMEVTLVPETNYVCAVHVRQKKEDSLIAADEGAKIVSDIEKDFALEVPPGSFEEETILSLQVYETNEDGVDEGAVDGGAVDDGAVDDGAVDDDAVDDGAVDDVTDTPQSVDAGEASPDTDQATKQQESGQEAMDDGGDTGVDGGKTVSRKRTRSPTTDGPPPAKKPANPNLLTDVYQINISGQQPKKGIMVQIPMCKGMKPDDEIAIVRADENDLQSDSDVLDVLPETPKFVGGNLVFQVSHFCVYVATWKKRVDTSAGKQELQRSISSAREKRKPAALYAVLKKDETDETGLRHILIVECAMATRSAANRKRWMVNGFKEQNPPENNEIMLAAGETLFADVKGNVTLEDEDDARERKIQFSPVRPSFQPYKINLKQGIYNAEEANGHVIISKMKDAGREEVTQLRVTMTPPPRPPSPPPPTPPTQTPRVSSRLSGSQNERLGEILYRAPEEVYKPDGNVADAILKFLDIKDSNT